MSFLFTVVFQIIVKKREPLSFGNQDGSAGFSSRLAATQDVPFIHQSVSMLSIWLACSFQINGGGLSFRRDSIDVPQIALCWKSRIGFPRGAI